MTLLAVAHRNNHFWIDNKVNQRLNSVRLVTSGNHRGLKVSGEGSIGEVLTTA
ncbi:hypothetical protein OIU77_002970 [Salix suchowensis]|uniref:Uncharacterized protein n=1 Tax=Salix suchowensis TaxID=1278906 RepID=A0ABQ9B0B5_9ROSI|nr:hypothetical protein OIU77_002970 [Salix suchowensis]